MEKYKSLSDEIKAAKAWLYGLLLISSEVAVRKPTENEIKLMEILSVDEQIKEQFKPKTNGDEPK